MAGPVAPLCVMICFASPKSPHVDVAVAVDQHVRGLDIPVHVARPMDGVQPRGRAPDQLDRTPGRQRPVASDEPLEVLTGDQPHREELRRGRRQRALRQAARCSRCATTRPRSTSTTRSAATACCTVSGEYRRGDTFASGTASLANLAICRRVRRRRRVRERGLLRLPHRGARRARAPSATTGRSARATRIDFSWRRVADHADQQARLRDGLAAATSTTSTPSST